MHHHWRAGTLAGLLAAVTACGGVKVHEFAPVGAISLQPITVERIQGCADEFGGQLNRGDYKFHPIVQVDTDGVKRGVEIEGIPDTAPDLAACMRIALRDMTIPSEVFNLRQTPLTASTNEPTKEQRSYLGHPVVVVVVVVGLGEIVLEAGAATILFAVTVKVVEKAKDDVAELAKRRRNPKDECAEHYAKCMFTASGDTDGNHWKQSLCGICASTCVNNVVNKGGSWPSQVGNGSCEYWKPLWGWN